MKATKKNVPALVEQNSLPTWSPEQVQLLKNTVCKGATDDEFKIFCYAVQRTGLDPFMKQIHAVKRYNKKTQRDEMQIQVGIDGYRLVADRTEKCAGIDDPVYEGTGKIPSKATVTVHKIVSGTRAPFTASARWDEYVPQSPQDFMWRKMPYLMLGKVAEALALRKAFPAELSGVYTHEEMEQADSAAGSSAGTAGAATIPPAGATAAGSAKPAITVPNETAAANDRLTLCKKIVLLSEQLNLDQQVLKDWVSEVTGKASLKACAVSDLEKMIAALEKEVGASLPDSGGGEQKDGDFWKDERR